LSYFAADCLSPQSVQEAIRLGAADAVRRSRDMRSFVLPPPIVLEIDTIKTAQADALDGVRGFKRTGARTIAYGGGDMAEVYRALISIIHLGAAAA
jgi:D-aminopeptidase